MALTPSFLHDLETNMKIISSKHYQRLQDRVWWQKVAKLMKTNTRKERVHWLLDTAKIQKQDDGEVRFEELVMQSYEMEHEFAGTALRLNKTEFTDLDANGVQLATEWSRQAGLQAAYWPQKSLAKAIIANPTCYDNLAFFAKDHPINPFDTGAGTYHNLLTGEASGAYPGAVDISEAVSLDTAISNLAKARTYVSRIKSPNGEDPRNLMINAILAPPSLETRLIQLTSAKDVVRNGPGSSFGTENVEAVIRSLNLGQPIIAPELGAEYSGSDTDYYLLCSEIASDDLGAFAYLDREPFQIGYHGPFDDAKLQRTKVFEWEMSGRNAVVPGHPFMMFKCRAA